MSLRLLAMGVFFVLVGCTYLFALDGDVVRVVTGIAALVAGVLCFLGDHTVGERR